MSIDYTIWIGPYAEVRPGKEAPSWGDVIDTIKEQLRHHEFPDGTHVWFPNVDREEPRQMYFDPEEGQSIILVEPSQQVSEASWFLYHFGPEHAALERAALERAYGTDRVRVRWGVLIMAS